MINHKSKPSQNKKDSLQSKEKKELIRLNREMSRPKRHGYLWYMLLIITVVYIADEIATQVGAQMQTTVALALFPGNVEVAVARLTAFSFIPMLFTALGFLYKPLSDRFGRKVFLVINTLGLGVAMIVISISTNLPVYLLGAALTQFFIPHDVQQTYIYECAPKHKRGTYYAIAKFFATLGMLLIPLMRQLFIPSEAYIDQWGFVYLVPGLLALVVAVFAILFVRESDTFVEHRIKLLTMSEEEKAKERLNKKQATQEKGSIISGIRYVFSHKQLLWLVIAHSFIMLALFITTNYEAILTNGYSVIYFDGFVDFLTANNAAEFNALNANRAANNLTLFASINEAALVFAKNKATTEFITKALFLFPLGSASVQLFQGFFSDKLGRRPTAIIVSITCLSSFLIFYFGSQAVLSPYLVGFFVGSAVGSYYGLGDIMFLMETESTPTNLRSSVLAVTPLLAAFLYAIAMPAFATIINLTSDKMIGPLAFIFAVPGLIVGLILLFLKARETKGVDLTKIDGTEFENTMEVL